MICLVDCLPLCLSISFFLSFCFHSCLIISLSLSLYFSLCLSVFLYLQLCFSLYLSLIFSLFLPSPVSRHRHGSGGRVLAVIPPSPVMRRSSEPHLSPSSSNNNVVCSDTPPSAHGCPSDGSEGGGSYCELRPGQPPTPPSKSYVERLRVEEGRAPGSAPTDGGESFTVPLVESSSCLRPGQYQSALLPAENKPLEMGVLKRVKELLAEVDPKTAAKHITKADCTVRKCVRTYL